MATPGPNLPDLRVGARGPAVLAVQRHLAQKELYTGPIDGRFGQQTDAAVRSLQSSQGLRGDGIVGPATWAALADTGLDLAALATPRDGDEASSASGTADTGTTSGDDEALTTSGVAEEETPATPPSRADETISMSTSVRYTAGRVGTDELSAYEVVAELLKSHPTYADGRARFFDVGAAPPGAERLGFGEWLMRVRPLFDPALLDELTTRTVVWGLALLDRQLLTRLERDGFLEAFRAHRTEEILSP